MTLLKHLPLVIFLLFVQYANSQEITFYGKVVDIDGDPAHNVTYFLKSRPEEKMKTDREGNFEVKLDFKDYDSLIFKSVQFERQAIYLGKRLHKRAIRNNRSYSFRVELEDRQFNILTVRPNVPDTLFGTQEYSVEDFEFLEDGRMILLTYEKTLKKGGVLRLLDEDMVEIDKHYIAGDAIELRKDFRNKIHLLAEERVFLVYVDENELHIAMENRDYYFKYVAPLIDTIGSNIYFSNYSDIYPAFDYFEFNRDDSTYNVLLKVEDTLMMELYRSEFKYVDVRTKLWAHQKQIETGIDKEIWVGATVFTNSIYYEPLYAPLFKTGQDSLLVFDHYKNRMFRYTPQDGFVDSTRISYHLDHRRSGWEQPLIQDEKTGRVYALFLKGGYTYLSEIDKNTGHVKKSFKLYFKYVERIRIIDQKVYYIYRPFESVQKKYIYQEKLS
ncbi:MAG: hypothetical protein HUJ25_00790 [Crocinitomicaceae bacterium]|nr:hypothetical protein [Crocinitomicaceae bacterium]